MLVLTIKPLFRTNQVTEKWKAILALLTQREASQQELFQGRTPRGVLPSLRSLPASFPGVSPSLLDGSARRGAGWRRYRQGRREPGEGLDGRPRPLVADCVGVPDSEGGSSF